MSLRDAVRPASEGWGGAAMRSIQKEASQTKGGSGLAGLGQIETSTSLPQEEDSGHL